MTKKERWTTAAIVFFLKDGTDRRFVFSEAVTLKELLEGYLFDLNERGNNLFDIVIDAVNRVINTDGVVIVSRSQEGLRLRLVFGGRGRDLILEEKTARLFFAF